MLRRLINVNFVQVKQLSFQLFKSCYLKYLDKEYPFMRLQE